ncbi:MAG: hypothetical protein DWQ07_03560 [Chloroflexi bacterium]|nr:MAG: hypothetical protein DWQ07_03560 [Chloroflexota bacterium]MBL1193421.1 hypothetical protein [Chloroflexota bacterium]NOH10713.1 hypothetical protein [Chloroflexota bacterium]
MKRLRWPLLIAGLAVVAIAIVLLGRQPLAEAVLPSGVTGGVYTEGLVGDLQRLNPLLDYYNPADRDVDSLIFSRLIRFDDSGNPVPDLAETWGVSLDGKVYNFKIWEDAVWHDGQDLTADDILFTINLMLDPSIPVPSDIRSLWENIDVRVLDEHHIQFVLTEPYAPFIEQLSFGILPQHLLGDLAPNELVNAPFNLAPVGSGAYRLEEVSIEESQIVGVILSAFPDYYGEETSLSQVVFRYYETTDDALTAYQNGDVLGISQVTPDALEDVLSVSSLNIYTARLPQVTTVLFNLESEALPFFQNANVRKALLYGLNRSWMISNLLDGQAIQADGPIFPGTWAYFEEVPRTTFDPEEAISILKEEGYVISADQGGVRELEGARMDFELVHPDTPQHTAIAESIRDNWAVIGVRVQLVAVDYQTLLNNYLDPRSYDAALVDLSYSRSPDPDPYPFWHQAEATGGQNYSAWSDRRASEYLEKARVSVNPVERERLYRNFQIHFSRELPALLLFYPTYTFAVDARIQGVATGPLFETSDRFINVGQWTVVTGVDVAEPEAEIERAEPALEN